MIGQELRLVSRPTGLPVAEDLALVDVEVPEPGPGQVLVRNHYLSVDPGIILKMKDWSGFDMPTYLLDAPLWSDGVGEVVDSRHPDFSPGDAVWHRSSWCTYTVDMGENFQPVDDQRYPQLSHHLSFGDVAFVATALAEIQPGETVWVSSAAGAVGSIAGQLARLRGATVVGSVGGSLKARRVRTELGMHHAVDYRSGLHDQFDALGLTHAVDVSIDTVGGDHLEAAIDVLRPEGRIILCGQTAQLRSGDERGPTNWMRLIGKRLQLRSVFTFDHPDLLETYHDEFPALVRDGRVRLLQTVVDGLENGLDAILAQIRGDHVGKVVLRL